MSISDEIERFKHTTISDWRDVPGWFNFSGAYDLAIQHVQDGDNVLEIGSFLGKSSAYFADLIRKSGKNIHFYCVDPWKMNQVDVKLPLPYDFKYLFDKTLDELKLTDFVTAIQATSEDAYARLKDKRFKFILIDGLHDYPHVIQDLKLYAPLLTEDGLITGDDYLADGVQKAVRETFTEHTSHNSAIGCYWPWWRADKKHLVHKVRPVFNLTDSNSVVVGENSSATRSSVVVGNHSSAHNNSVAIGDGIHANDGLVIGACKIDLN